MAQPNEQLFQRLANALRGPEVWIPEVGDFVRVVAGLDCDYGRMGQVHKVIWNQNPGLRDVWVTLDPFEDKGPSSSRVIDPRHLEPLNAMEVLAEAAR